MDSKRSDRIGADDGKQSNFYTCVYDDAVARKKPLDNTIIEQICEVGGGRVESLARVFNGGTEGAASHHAVYSSSLAEIHLERDEAHQRYSSLVKDILKHESDLQAQEDRREEGERLLHRQQEETAAQEEKVESLQELIHKTRLNTFQTTEKVATYSTYREYVERSVTSFRREASSVEGVCGRFRDLLTLRLQLLLKVNLALLQLHQARRQLQVFVQSEKEREGEALLLLYRERCVGWDSSRTLGEMEARLSALQTASTHAHTHLTRVRLALVNIYSVARAYQRSLPPLGPRAATDKVLKRLHNFLLDAMTVTALARSALMPASLRPSAPSLARPVGSANRGSATKGSASKGSASKGSASRGSASKGSATKSKDSATKSSDSATKSSDSATKSSDSATKSSDSAIKSKGSASSSTNEKVDKETSH